jgi:peptidoglycan-associated lipoprotein
MNHPNRIEETVNQIRVGPWARAILPALVLVWAGCNPKPASVSPRAAADSAAAAARRDSLAAAARRDSLAAAARRDSLAAAARADSLARALEASRADSIRAEVRRNELAAAAARNPLDAASAAEFATVVRFAFDKSDLDAAARAILERKLRILQQNPGLVIQVAGNCDERGSDEYNLALGERRAAAVKRYLVEHGVADARVRIISYGEERPADPAHTEAAWAANRRADFTVVGTARP